MPAISRKTNDKTIFSFDVANAVSYTHLNFTQRLYVAYGPDVYFLRDFASDSANGTNTFDGFESGKVRISAGVDMPNYRNKADGKSALYTRFCIMGIRGADFTAQGDEMCIRDRFRTA